ncbi:MAG: hypothetical protein J7L19_05935, partial [Dehalococcoidia bacterium]|nr:hypothetical protein [Dehalococcoidia bacterium]
MKLGVFGSYNKTSIGDAAILEGITEQFKVHLDSLTVFAFSPAAIETTINFGNIKNKIISG